MCVHTAYVCDRYDKYVWLCIEKAMLYAYVYTKLYNILNPDWIEIYEPRIAVSVEWLKDL